MPPQILRRLLKRKADTHKYDFGHVLVIGGSPGMVGAPLLAARAALRVGAGLVTIASQPDVIDKIEQQVDEIMTLRLTPETAKSMPILKEFIKQRKVDVVVIGPGLGKDAVYLTRQVLRNLNYPTVVDAASLAAYRPPPHILNKNIILTPHHREFVKLTSVELPADKRGIKQAVLKFAKANKLNLVLKGHNTLVAHPSGKIYENKTGNPGLATAGTGDVLAGIIGGLLAQGLTAPKASEAGVYLHGLAGDLAAKTKTQPGLIATDVIEAIPEAYRSL